MHMPVSLLRRCLFMVLACAMVTGAFAYDGQVFRVCADPNNLPFSADTKDGLENKIASIWARELGLPIEYTWFPQRRGFVRKTLRALDESGFDYKCDVVMGVATGFDQLLTTKPYYRSTYALVYAKGRGLDDVSSGDQFINLDPEIRNSLKIGAFTPTPGTKWLSRHGMTEQMVAFVAMSGNPEEYPGEIVEKEIAGGNLDAAIVWGPIAGYFAKRAEGVEIVVIPLESEPGIRFDFAISAGVRYGDGDRKRALEDLMDRTEESMQAIFADYNVPLLDLSEAWIPPDDDD